MSLVGAGAAADAPVVVVGAGPVGLVTAVLLAQRGHEVHVLDQRTQPCGLPRAVHYDDEAARVLQATGILPELLPLTEPVGVYEWRTAAGDVLMAFDRSRPGPSGWPEGTMFAQPDLERLLTARLAQLPSARLTRGADVVAVEQLAGGETGDAGDGQGADGDGVVLRLADGASVRASYVVGADGAGSTVRDAMGVPVGDLGTSDVWLVVDVRTGLCPQPSAVQVCDPARPTTCVPGGRGRRRWEFMQLPGEDLRDRAWELLAPWGVTPDHAELERAAVYRFQARWADTWRDGRLVLAGDAAHEMPPFAGQGLCAGLRDAAALAWRLDLVLRGLAGPGLLDSYGPERLAHVRAFIDFSVELGKIICVTDPDEAAERDAALGVGGPPPTPGSSVLDVPLGPGLWREGDVLAGHLAPQGVVRRNGREGLADDVLGRGPVLVSLEDVSPSPPAAWGEAGGRELLARPGVDVDGTYAAWLRAAGRQVAVLRPDGYVFASGATEDATELVEDFVRQLTGSTT